MLNQLKSVRPDHDVICNIVEPRSRVLDLGCGSGNLLALLRDRKQVKGQGIERSEEAIFRCVEKGLSVFHMDFDSGLSSYTDHSFDYVILNQSLQETLHLEYVLNEALRVGKKVIVGFPNFANFRARFQLFFKGRTPVTRTLPYLWYNSPNLHFLTISDFRQFTLERDIEILDSRYLDRQSEVRLLPNLLAVSAVFVLARKNGVFSTEDSEGTEKLKDCFTR